MTEFADELEPMIAEEMKNPAFKAAWDAAVAELDSPRWVKRNEDKPHRCPECHAIADQARGCYGPRTRFTCPAGCGVQWRPGTRLSRSLFSRSAHWRSA